MNKLWFQKLAIPFINFGFHLFYRVKIEGREHIPTGSCVVCGNHSQYTDPLFIAISLSSKHDMIAMAKKELFRKKWVNILVSALGAFPVDRDKADLTAIKTALRGLSSGEKLIIFPEGTRKAESDGASKAGAAMLAIRAKVPVLPIYIPTGKKFRSRVVVRIGEPFYLVHDKKDEEGYGKAADEIIKAIYALKV